TRGEGLFVAVLRKTAEQKEWLPRKSKRSGKAPKLPTIDWLSGNDWHFTEHNGTICAIGRDHAPILDEISQCTKVIMAGIEVAAVKGKDLIPQHGLALSTSLRSDAFPRVELDYPTAINYLQREAITLPDGSPRGFVIVCHESMPLGFVKNLGNRANNLYPQEWRIRTSLPK
ncbi:MAG: rRNA cytosine-C5-methyltransferase, partial [Muribaculaceae bacterium]|nr:rRNA cytosine-C5-methyltransferase [Muribaculaceae bacterium]